MTVQEIKELIGAFSEAAVTEMDLELADGHLKLKKAIETQQAYDQLPVKQQSSEVSDSVNKELSDAPENASIEADLLRTDIKAPLAGIFYRSSSPDAKPYVEAGQEVKKGDTIGLIEAMKVMNEIPAPHDGIVAEILAENETFVAYEEILMKIEAR